MLPYKANLINGVVLIALSTLGYFLSDSPSLTALIPAGFGMVLLALTPGVKSENKAIAHIAVLLTLVLLFALIFMPLRGAIAREDTLAILRVCVMTATTTFAIVCFVKSFIDVRRSRAKNESS